MVCFCANNSVLEFTFYFIYIVIRVTDNYYFRANKFTFYFIYIVITVFVTVPKILTKFTFYFIYIVIVLTSKSPPITDNLHSTLFILL